MDFDNYQLPSPPDSPSPSELIEMLVLLNHDWRHVTGKMQIAVEFLLESFPEDESIREIVEIVRNSFHQTATINDTWNEHIAALKEKVAVKIK